MNIYELAIEAYKKFDGNKLTVWENKTNKSKVWMERSKNGTVFVYALQDNKMLLGRWEIGYLGKLSQNRYGIKLGYKLLNTRLLKTSYANWIRKM